LAEKSSRKLNLPTSLRVPRRVADAQQSVAAFFVARPALSKIGDTNVSDRKKYHIDKRAQTIIEMLVRKYKDLLKDRKIKDRDDKTVSLDQLLNTRQLAVLFGVSEVWLEILRQKKQGPEWIALGPRCIRYKISDVLAWLKVRARCNKEAS
jgi:predicted DNA-binding transcriptional regulator AlpA